MKVILTSEALKSAATIASLGIKRSISDSLLTVELKACSKGLSVRVWGESDIVIESLISADAATVIEEGVVFVSSQRFAAVAKTFLGRDVKLTSVENGDIKKLKIATLQTPMHTAQISQFNAALPNTPETSRSIELNAELLRTAVKDCIEFVSDNANRPAMCCEKLKVCDGQVAVEAIDGVQGSRNVYVDKGVSEKERFFTLLPKQLCKLLVALVKPKDENDTAFVLKGEKAIGVEFETEFGRIRAVSRSCVGEFPNTEPFYTLEKDTKLWDISADALLAAGKNTMAVMATDEQVPSTICLGSSADGAMAFVATAEGISIENIECSVNPDFPFADGMKCVISEDEVKGIFMMTVNPRYVLAAAKNLEGNVEVSASTCVGPIHLMGNKTVGAVTMEQKKIIAPSRFKPMAYNEFVARFLAPEGDNLI